jgi:hypothetical protein
VPAQFLDDPEPKDRGLRGVKEDMQSDQAPVEIAILAAAGPRGRALLATPSLQIASGSPHRQPPPGRLRRESDVDIAFR